MQFPHFIPGIAPKLIPSYVHVRPRDGLWRIRLGVVAASKMTEMKSARSLKTSNKLYDITGHSTISPGEPQSVKLWPKAMRIECGLRDIIESPEDGGPICFINFQLTS